jgi:hypothetical protein
LACYNLPHRRLPRDEEKRAQDFTTSQSRCEVLQQRQVKPPPEFAEAEKHVSQAKADAAFARFRGSQ